MKYKDKDYNDYELLSYIAEENEQANEILFKKYNPLIVSMATELYKHCTNRGLEINDLIQEGRLGLSKAISAYTDEKNTKFATFAKTCIRRSMISAIIETDRLKNKILNESISLDEEKEKSENANIDRILKDNSYNPEELFFNRETSVTTEENIKKTLTKLEKQVFELKADGFSNQEIAEFLDKDYKSIDNAIQRIKVKMKEYFTINQ